MRLRPETCPMRALAALVGGALLAALALGEPVAQSLGEGTLRYFPDQAALDGAHPSYAVLDSIRPLPGEPAAEGPFTPRFVTIDGRQAAVVTITPGTSLYGTGEAAGPLLRNGRRITCWNTDAYGYDAKAESLYQSHPWVLAVAADGSAVGLLADTTYRCVVDTGASKADEVRFVADGPAFGVIVIRGGSPQDVLRSLGRLTGLMPMPPKWAIGYHQCRYSYFPESRVREVARGFRERSIPADVIWFDIDYMEAFRVFTFDRGYFPDAGRLNADLLAMGFHNVWMIDPGIKADGAPGPSDRKAEDLAKDPPAAREARAREIAAFEAMLESGRLAGVFVRTASGEEYRGAVWPGACVFPDYTWPPAREWWSRLYGPFLEHGITGVWNDMNEPAVFNVASKTMPEDNAHRGDPGRLTPAGSAQGESGALGTHARYHNVYGMEMIRGTREGILAARPDKRPFVLSRANYIGGHRYGATWTGDNTADWSHLEMSIPMALNVGLSGQPFIGPDIGGFAGSGDGRLFARWMGLGAMLPFARGHTEKSTRDKEPWAFDDQTTETCRQALRRRYRLLPYYYTVFREAAVTGLPVARPVFFADPADPALRSEDDSFLVGSDVLVVANVVEHGKRAAVMPRGAWRRIEAGDNADLPGLFVREGAIVPAGPDIQFTGEKALDPLTLIVNPDHAGRASGVLYEDAGEGFGYQRGEYLLTTYRATSEGGVVTVAIDSAEGSMARPPRTLIVRVLLHDRVAEGGGPDGLPVRIRTRAD
jgi:alpha-glucosidase